MKHIFIYLTIIVLSMLCVVIIKTNSEKLPAKIYTVNTYYSYVIDHNDTIDLFFYINDDHVLEDEDAYDIIYLENDDQSKSLSLDVQALKYVDDESYLGETYHKYVLMLDMPTLNVGFKIDEMYASIYLINGQHYRFYMGSLSLYKPVQEEMSYLDWQGLSAIKKEGSKLSRIHEIYITYLHLDKTITYVEIGEEKQVSHTIEDDKITLTLADENQLLYATPIIIHYLDDTIQIIDYFLYINDFQILKESGYLLNGYELS